MSVREQLRQFRYTPLDNDGVSWRLIRAVNTASAVDEEPDLQLMKHLLSELSTCALSMSTVQKTTDVELLQLLRVYQIALQFSLWSQNVLKEQLVAAQQTKAVQRVTTQYVSALESKRDCLSHDLEKLRQERDTLQLTSASNQQLATKYETRCRMLERQLDIERGRGDALQRGLERQAEVFHAQALASSAVGKDAQPAPAALPAVFMDPSTGDVAWQRDRKGRAQCPLCHQRARVKRAHHRHRSHSGSTLSFETSTQDSLSTLTRSSSGRSEDAAYKYKRYRPRGSRGATATRHHRSRSRHRHREDITTASSATVMDSQFVDWASFGRHLLLQQEQQLGAVNPITHHPMTQPFSATPSTAVTDARVVNVVLDSAGAQNTASSLLHAAGTRSPLLPLGETSFASQSTSHVVAGTERTSALPRTGSQRTAPSGGQGVGTLQPHQRFPSGGSLTLDAKQAVDSFVRAASRQADGCGSPRGSPANADCVDTRLRAISLAVDALNDDMQEQIADVMRSTETAITTLSHELSDMTHALRAEQAEQRALLNTAITNLHDTVARTLEQSQGTAKRMEGGGPADSATLALEAPRSELRRVMIGSAPTLLSIDSNSERVSSGAESGTRSVLKRPPTVRRVGGQSPPTSPPPLPMPTLVTKSTLQPLVRPESIMTEELAGMEPLLTASPVDLRRAVTEPNISLTHSRLGTSPQRETQTSASVGAGQPRRVDSGASSFISLAEIRRTQGDEDNYSSSGAADQGGAEGRDAAAAHNTVRGLNESEAGSPVPMMSKSAVVEPVTLADSERMERRAAATFDNFDVSVLLTPTKTDVPLTVRELQLDAEAGNHKGHYSLSSSTEQSRTATAKDAGAVASTAGLAVKQTPAKAGSAGHDDSMRTSASLTPVDPQDLQRGNSSTQNKKVIGSINSSFFQLSESDGPQPAGSSARGDASAGSPLSGVLKFASSSHSQVTAPSRGGSMTGRPANSAAVMARKKERVTAKSGPASLAMPKSGSLTSVPVLAPKKDASSPSTDEEDLRHLTPKPSAASHFSEDMPAGAAARSAALFTGSLNSTGYANFSEDQPAAVSVRAASQNNHMKGGSGSLNHTRAAPVSGAAKELNCVYCKKPFPQSELQAHEDYCAIRHRELDVSQTLSRGDSLNSSHRPASIMLHETQRELEALLREEEEASATSKNAAQVGGRNT